MIFFTGDTHFGDPRVLRIDRRPFPDMSAHDAALIQNWNAVVGVGNDVWHLGDVMAANAGDCAELLGVLHGRKHLIVGNNDPETTARSDGWTTAQNYAELRDNGHHFVLCQPGIRWARDRSICTATPMEG
jgi:calcineurin-like phosphoesterase family protein